MSYRIDDIPSMLDALDKASHLIASGEYTYICAALQRINSSGATKARELIRESLGGSHWTTLDDWVLEETDCQLQPDELRQLRLQWIDKIAADLIGFWHLVPDVRQAYKELDASAEAIEENLT